MTLFSRVVFLLCSGLLASAQAAEFSVAPIRVPLTPKLRSTTVTVSNNSAEPVTFLVRGTEWRQDAAGNDVYEPSDQVLFTPSLLRVTHDSPRALRVGVPLPGEDRERTYRVWLDEQPTAAAGAGAFITVALRFGLPVFVAPQQVRTASEIAALARVGDELHVQVANVGNTHFRVDAITVNGTAVPDHRSWYLLAGARRTYVLPWQSTWCADSAVRVNVATSYFDQVQREVGRTLSDACARG